MNRTLAFLATGLCAAPLLTLAGFAITSAVVGPSGGGSDQTIARGYISLLGGMALAVVGFVVLGYAAQRFVPAQHWRYLLAADVILLVLGLAVWRPMLASDRKLEYADASPVLQVELRIAQTVLASDPIDAVASIDFIGGTSSSVPHPEAIRQDGDAFILPWETTPLRLRAWEVRVFVRTQPVLFELPLPSRPAHSPAWSNWIQPSAHTDYTTPQGVSLRYRFLLRPHGS